MMELVESLLADGHYQVSPTTAEEDASLMWVNNGFFIKSLDVLDSEP